MGNIFHSTLFSKWIGGSSVGLVDLPMRSAEDGQYWGNEPASGREAIGFGNEASIDFQRLQDPTLASDDVPNSHENSGDSLVVAGAGTILHDQVPVPDPGEFIKSFLSEVPAGPCAPPSPPEACGNVISAEWTGGEPEVPVGPCAPPNTAEVNGNIVPDTWTGIGEPEVPVGPCAPLSPPDACGNVIAGEWTGDLAFEQNTGPDGLFGTCNQPGDNAEESLFNSADNDSFAFRSGFCDEQGAVPNVGDQLIEFRYGQSSDSASVHVTALSEKAIPTVDGYDATIAAQDVPLLNLAQDDFRI